MKIATATMLMALCLFVLLSCREDFGVQGFRCPPSVQCAWNPCTGNPCGDGETCQQCGCGYTCGGRSPFKKKRYKSD
ncbi:hypothetical protein PoB_000010400 [Plakobranchus ocellatus]|uniref:Uncharacterized protein n=1 Tax=Plakobranchus ocellatus TaxID=259542 RepID=A0AAV3XV11_9GAST|nr:hypothetical protein PoB_000010400 [Plakobranchus ocellatus]